MFKWLKEKFENKEEKDLKKYEDIGETSAVDIEIQGIDSTLEEDLIYKETDALEAKATDESVENKANLIDIENVDEISKSYEEKAEEIQEFESEEVIDEAVTEEKQETKEKVSFFKKIFSGLEKTRNNFTNKINEVLGSYVKIDDEMYEDLEDILITADVGVDTTVKLIDNLRETIKREKVTEPSLVTGLLANEAKKLIALNDEVKSYNPEISPTIVLVVGVNGVGKTTTIGKLANKYKNEGKKVLLVAADTFRAAATEQLQEWANRSNVDIIHHEEGSDPAAVVFDAIQAAKARKSDIILCDTAGRLHNKANLMNELDKIYRIIDKNFSEANKESLIVLDATTGQNALLQAKEFKQVAKVSGIVITKLDGTAKGGIVLPLINELKVPVVYIGVGEKVEDLQEFNYSEFIDSIFVGR